MGEVGGVGMVGCGWGIYVMVLGFRGGVVFLICRIGGILERI